MHTTSFASGAACWCPNVIRDRIPFHHLHLSRKSATSFPCIRLALFSESSKNHTSFCSQEKVNDGIRKNDLYPSHTYAFADYLDFSSDSLRKIINPIDVFHVVTEREFIDNQREKLSVILSNMWWTELNAALGQRSNLEALISSAAVVMRDRHLALPHVSVPDIRYIDWLELQRRGFKGVVFDKDNTITIPYSLKLWGPIGCSLERCKSVFGDNIVVFSNSAGLHEYDPDESKARALEKVIGIRVLRHKIKKPAGRAEEIEQNFGCASSELIMVGDRQFTDIVYGNRNGFLTILTSPLSLAEEPFIVKQVRKLEAFFVRRWCREGLKPTRHRLLPDALQCVKVPPTL